MKEIIILLLLVNGIFWGLFPHSFHCQVLSKFTNVACPPHIIHMIIGIISFVAAVILSQDEYVAELTESVSNVYRQTAKIVQSAGKLAKISVAAVKENFSSIDDFANKVEKFAKQHSK